MGIATAILGLAAGSMLSTIGATSIAACKDANAKAAKDGKNANYVPTIVGAVLTAGGVGLTAYSGYALGEAKKKPKPNPVDEDALADLYRDFHWGDEPTGTRRETMPDTNWGVYSLGRLVAVEYRAKKNGKTATWRHKFSRPYPHLTGTPDGKLGPILGGRARVHADGIVD